MKREFHHILLVDDDITQQFLSRRALVKALSSRSTISLVDSGNKAIDYMIGEGEFGDRALHPFPTIVITDLNMPDGDGFDILEFMQCNPEWSVVPRIMMSSSADDDDVRTAFSLGVSAYHLKGDGPDLERCMRRIVEYWTSCEVPPVDRNGRLLVTRNLGGPGARYRQPTGGRRMQRPQGVPSEKSGVREEAQCHHAVR
jgi:CheY-like chemotaxis protein